MHRSPFGVVIVLVDEVHPLHDAPSAAAKALHHWGLSTSAAPLTCSSAEEAVRLLTRSGPQSSIALLVNLSAHETTQRALGADLLQQITLLCAESVLLGFDPGFNEQHSTIRTLISTGLKQHRLAGLTLESALVFAAEARALHPYFNI